MQYLDRDPAPKSRKFMLTQQWTVKAPPARAAESLDIAVNNGANSTGQIEWTVKDEYALEDQALDGASERATQIAAVLAKGMGVRVGTDLREQPGFRRRGFPRPMMAASIRRSSRRRPWQRSPRKCRAAQASTPFLRSSSDCRQDAEQPGSFKIRAWRFRLKPVSFAEMSLNCGPANRALPTAARHAASLKGAIRRGNPAMGPMPSLTRRAEAQFATCSTARTASRPGGDSRSLQGGRRCEQALDLGTEGRRTFRREPADRTALAIDQKFCEIPLDPRGRRFPDGSS